MSVRIERDSLGEKEVPLKALYGIHTVRALENFPISGRGPHPFLIRAYGAVKKAALTVNRSIGKFAFDNELFEALDTACDEMGRGELNEHVIVDALQGGAGTSTNMNVNEVLANRALVLLGHPPGSYNILSPMAHVNLHQSTNDTYPTALKLAGMWLLTQLEHEVLALQEAFQIKERQFAHVVKVGRTQYQDAVLTTAGRQFGAYADALGRDRWRIYKCQERLRVVNLGGTAIGTGIGAPRQYIFQVVDTLREQTGMPLARAENLLDGTQNADVFVEVSGMVSALAATLHKIASDIRFLSSGPAAGIQELRLEQRQVGSSIMPAKVNPVIPEAVIQVAMQVFGSDAVIKNACANGSLELNPFLPLVAEHLLSSMECLSGVTSAFNAKCVQTLQVNETVCADHVKQSTATATVLVSRLGYETVASLIKDAAASNCSLQALVLEKGLMTQGELDGLLSHAAVCKLGD